LAKLGQAFLDLETVALAPELGIANCGECAEEGREFGRVVTEECFEIGAIEITDHLGKLGGSELESGFVNSAAAVRAGEVHGDFLFDADFLEALEFPEPILVAAAEPTGEVVLGDTCVCNKQRFENFRVREAVEEHKIDLIANGFRQTSDLAATAVLGRWLGGGVGGLGLGIGGIGIFGVHRKGDA